MTTLDECVAQVMDLDGCSEDQREALSAIRTWLSYGTHTQPVFTLRGFAGTGKSFIVSLLAKELPLVAYCAFTGKASSVLARKLAQAGVRTSSKIITKEGGGDPRTPYCGTIHGLCYRACPRCIQEDITLEQEDITLEQEHTLLPGCKQAPAGAKPPKGSPPGWVSECIVCVTPATVRKRNEKAKDDDGGGPCSVCFDRRFLRRDELDRPYALIVVDEASMVADDVKETLERHNIPILAVGDPGQLPPIRGQGSLMDAPGVLLSRIHRQAEDNPIIALSARIRATGDIDDSLEDGVCFTILPRRGLGDWIGERFPARRLFRAGFVVPPILGSVLISWTNKLRVGLNQDVRAALGTGDGLPAEGEVVVCLKNTAPIYNGMRAVLEQDGRQGGGPKTGKVFADLWFAEDNVRARSIGMSEHQFFAEKTLDFEEVRKMGVSFASLGGLYDFGYAVTCHKFQGSQAPDVGVVIEPGLMRMSKQDRTAWLYTAATRAAERLTVIR